MTRERSSDLSNLNVASRPLKTAVASFIADLMKPVNQEIDLRVHAIPRLPGMGIEPILDGLIEPGGTAQIEQGLR